MTISRREFIARIAQAGGYGAAFMTMHSLGLLGMVETEQRKDFPLPPSTGRGTKVIILGAGIAGLSLSLTLSVTSVLSPLSQFLLMAGRSRR